LKPRWKNLFGAANMSYHKLIAPLLTLLIILYIVGCATTYAPDNWLPDTDQIQEEAFGGWITIITLPDSLESNDKWMQYSGEFISLDEGNVYVIYDSLFIISKNKIYSSTIELDAKSDMEYGLWTSGGTLLTIATGKYSVILAPIWLLAGIPTAVSESARDRYEMIHPDEEYWEAVKKFSRFPQGVNGIDLKNLRMKQTGIKNFE
jgi:hypothetical protein